MKFKFLFITIILFSLNSLAQTAPCGSIVNDTFDGTSTTLPDGWAEYNTSGRISVNSGRLKFDHNTSQPSAIRTFTPTSDDFSFSFDVSATRNSVNCQINLLSSTGKHLTTIAVGVQTASIKYATSITGGVPGGFTTGLQEGGFTTNTIFSISARANFTEKTIDFYNAGKLMVADIPFLEAAEDVAKIDIKLIYMYSNNGQFYFDNISIFSASENRTSLLSTLNLLETQISESRVGSIYGEYSQAAVDTFQLAIDQANTVLADCDALSETIDQTIVDLQTAKETFEASQVNDPVLKFYSEYNFGGNEHEIYCGYYNGGLGEYEDWAVSFKLEKGYMATFAEDVNGLGYSKVYIAQDNDLEINLPSKLQKSISFIRVSPWYPVGKKGSLGGDIKWSAANNYNTTWHYTWGLDMPDSRPKEVQFVPMSWSKGDNWTSLEKMKEVGENMDFNNLMAFNEPDNKDQSNLTVEEALEAYPKLLASGLRLGAPGVENVQYSTANDSFNEGSWIQRFMDSCVVRGYRVDFIPAHDYVRRSKSTFLERFKALHDRYNLPVWVTEYNYGNPNFGSAPLTVEQGYTNIKGLTEVLEESDFIERYNWYYFFGSTSGIGGITNGALNITGQFYRDLESTNPSYIQEIYEQGVLNVSDVQSFKSTLLYPNPVTSNTLQINYGELATANNATVKIYNVLGKEVLNKTNSPQQIDVSNLENGIYLVTIIAEGISISKKMMITK